MRKELRVVSTVESHNGPSAKSRRNTSAAGSKRGLSGWLHGAGQIHEGVGTGELLTEFLVIGCHRLSNDWSRPPACGKTIQGAYRGLSVKEFWQACGNTARIARVHDQAFGFKTRYPNRGPSIYRAGPERPWRLLLGSCAT
jgi:hypothetical protein